MKKYEYTIYLMDWLDNSSRVISFNSLSLCKRFIKSLFKPAFTKYVYVVRSHLDCNSNIQSKIVYKRRVKTLFGFDYPVINISEFRVIDYEK